MIKTTWEQNYPYNCAHPLWNEADFWEWVYSEGRKGTTGPNMGCVPIAVSQIMFSFKYPSSKYAFDRMPLTLTTHLGDRTLPEFIRRIGGQCGITYTAGQTGSDLNGATLCLGGNGYSVQRVKFSNTRVASSLDAGSPVVMGGVGHAWIWDGYFAHSVDHEFSLMIYTGDLAEVNPIAAFVQYMRTSTNSSSSGLHMVWGWEQSVNGYYSGESWTVPRYGTYKNPDCLVNISHQ